MFQLSSKLLSLSCALHIPAEFCDFFSSFSINSLPLCISISSTVRGRFFFIESTSAHLSVRSLFFAGCLIHLNGFFRFSSLHPFRLLCVVVVPHYHFLLTTSRSPQRERFAVCLLAMLCALWCQYLRCKHILMSKTQKKKEQKAKKVTKKVKNDDENGGEREEAMKKERKNARLLAVIS